MSKKENKKESNLKLTLAASILFIVLILICLIDTLKNLDNGASWVIIIMSLFFVGCVIALLWFVWFIIKRMKAENKSNSIKR